MSRNQISAFHGVELPHLLVNASNKVGQRRQEEKEEEKEEEEKDGGRAGGERSNRREARKDGQVR